MSGLVWALIIFNIDIGTNLLVRAGHPIAVLLPNEAVMADTSLTSYREYTMRDW